MGNYYYAYSRQTIIHDELQELIDLVEHQNNPKISSLFNEMVKNSCTEEYLISEYYSKRNPLQALMFEYPNVIREYDGDYMEAYCVPAEDIPNFIEWIKNNPETTAEHPFYKEDWNSPQQRELILKFIESFHNINTEMKKGNYSVPNLTAKYLNQDITKDSIFEKSQLLSWIYDINQIKTPMDLVLKIV